LAVGGYEERINVIHWSKAEQSTDEGCILDGHEGTITALSLFKNEYLMSAAEDSKICVWKLHPPALYHTFKYKEPIKTCLHLCIHPTGKILLSLHLSGYLLMWNLITGHYEFQRKVDITASKVEFLLEGDYYYILTKAGIKVYSIKSDESINTLLIDNDEILSACGIGNCIYAVTANQVFVKWVINNEGKTEDTVMTEDIWEGKGKLIEACKDNDTTYIVVVTVEDEIIGIKMIEEPEVIFETKLKSKIMCLGISVTAFKYKPKKKAE
jgi:WD40 repeat protein